MSSWPLPPSLGGAADEDVPEDVTASDVCEEDDNIDFDVSESSSVLSYSTCNSMEAEQDADVELKRSWSMDDCPSNDAEQDETPGVMIKGKSESGRVSFYKDTDVKLKRSWSLDTCPSNSERDEIPGVMIKGKFESGRLRFYEETDVYLKRSRSFDAYPSNDSEQDADVELKRSWSLDTCPSNDSEQDETPGMMIKGKFESGHLNFYKDADMELKRSWSLDTCLSNDSEQDATPGMIKEKFESGHLSFYKDADEELKHSWSFDACPSNDSEQDSESDSDAAPLPFEVRSFYDPQQEEPADARAHAGRPRPRYRTVAHYLSRQDVNAVRSFSSHEPLPEDPLPMLRSSRRRPSKSTQEPVVFDDITPQRGVRTAFDVLVPAVAAGDEAADDLRNVPDAPRRSTKKSFSSVASKIASSMRSWCSAPRG